SPTFQTATAHLKVRGKTYPSSGSFLSRSFDVGFTTNTWFWNWLTFFPNHSLPTGTNITYETQTSSSSTGGFDSLISVSSGNPPTSTRKEFIRYKASFTTTSSSVTPQMNDVTINMSTRLRPSATFYSQVKNAPNLTAWDSFSATTMD